MIGADVAIDLFTQESPIGQNIVIGDWPFMVVGVLDWVGDPDAGIPAGPDNGIYAPFKAVAAAFRGNENAEHAALPAADPEAGEPAVAATRVILEGLRRQRGETSGEYQVSNTIEQVGGAQPGAHDRSSSWSGSWAASGCSSARWASRT